MYWDWTSVGVGPRWKVPTVLQDCRSVFPNSTQLNFNIPLWGTRNSLCSSRCIRNQWTLPRDLQQELRVWARMAHNAGPSWGIFVYLAPVIRDVWQGCGIGPVDYGYPMPPVLRAKLGTQFTRCRGKSPAVPGYIQGCSGRPPTWAQSICARTGYGFSKTIWSKHGWNTTAKVPCPCFLGAV